MDIEKAIKTAIDYEKRVCDVYARAVDLVQDPTGRKVLATLSEEEKGHVAYLEHCLATWKEKGTVTAGRLATAVPAAGSIEAGVRRLEEKLGGRTGGGCGGQEVEVLRRALEVEIETGEFYRGLVRVMPPEARGLFDRFAEIEDGHRAVVAAEIDSVTRMGFWFDMREFDLEAG